MHEAFPLHAAQILPRTLAARVSHPAGPPTKRQNEKSILSLLNGPPLAFPIVTLSVGQRRRGQLVNDNHKGVGPVGSSKKEAKLEVSGYRGLLMTGKKEISDDRYQLIFGRSIGAHAGCSLEKFQLGATVCIC